MFKLLKSKKGFTLVELMIVVVIMAILVAVAVPIFSAVTKNARIKTCAANQREIEGQLNTYAMSQQAALTGTITLTTNDDGDGAAVVSTVTGLDAAGFEALFQESPYCPVAGAVVTVTLAASTLASDEAGGISVSVACDQTDHVAD